MPTVPGQTLEARGFGEESSGGSGEGWNANVNLEVVDCVIYPPWN